MRIYIFAFVLFATGCGHSRKLDPGPPGYNLQRPHVVNLPSELDEISGLAYYPKDRSLFTISDEKGFLYKVNPAGPLSIQKWKFSKKGDFEDLVLLDSTFYVLQSKGDLHVVRFLGKDSIYTTEIAAPCDGGEFETLYYDPAIQKLVLVCKDCGKEDRDMLLCYSFDPAMMAFSDSTTSIDISSLSKQLGEKNFHFKASAAAVNPLTGELCVISSVNKMLLVIGKDRTIKSFHKLDAGLFKQPEGISFSDTGTLVISNEAAGAGTANILFFNYTKP